MNMPCRVTDQWDKEPTLELDLETQAADLIEEWAHNVPTSIRATEFELWLTEEIGPNAVIEALRLCICAPTMAIVMLRAQVATGNYTDGIGPDCVKEAVLCCLADPGKAIACLQQHVTETAFRFVRGE